MAIELRAFFQIALISILGLLFYYSNLFLGTMNGSIMVKVVAVLILLITIPLPILAVHNKNMFKGTHRGLRHLIVLASMGLLFHHALLTFVIVLFTGNVQAF